MSSILELAANDGFLATTVKSAIKPIVETAQFLQVDTGAPGMARSQILEALFSVPFGKIPPNQQLSWWGSAMDLAIPGSASIFFPTVQWSPEPVTDDTLKAYFPKYPKGDAGKKQSFDDIVYGIRPAQTPVGSMITSVAILASIIFAIGKRPTRENYEAFSVRRLKAIAGKAAEATISASRTPPVEFLQAVNGFFNMRPKLRETFVKELIGLVAEPTTVEGEVIATTVKLWARTGLGHLFLVRSFLRGYEDQVVMLVTLKDQVDAAKRSYEHYARAQDPYKAYSKILHGERSPYGQAKEYADLLVVARDVMGRTQKTMNNYASGVGESSYTKELEGICGAMNVYFPAKRV